MNTVENLLPDHLKEGLSLAERKLLQCLPVGEIADLHAGEEAEDDPEQWSSWGPERTIRADLLAYLCSSQQVRALVHPKGLQLNGARIQGMLDVEGTTISFGLSLQDGAIPDGLILSNARIGSLSLDGSYLGPVTGNNMVIEGPMLLKQVRVRGQVQLETMRIGGNLNCTGGHFENPEGNALSFDNASIKGDVFLDTGFQAKGQVSLLGADIGGQLICTEGHFENPEGDALRFDNASIKGHVFLDRGFQAKGEVRLLGADIGALICSGGHFENPGGNALSFDNASIKGHVFLDRGFQAKGKVRLLGADIGGQLNCTEGHFENPEGDALSFDNASIKGHVFLDTGFQAKGEVRLLGADLGDLSCRGGHFENPDGDALFFDGASIKGSLFLDAGFQAKGTMNLGYAKVRLLVDDPRSWPDQDALIIEGFEYTAFAGDAPATAEERLKWLRLQPYKSRFVPQTYDQLAMAFRRMGLEADATRVMIAKQKDLIRYGRLTWWGRFTRRVLGWTVGHGYQSWRALVWMTGFFLIGLVLFYLAEHAGLISPSQRDVSSPFYAWLYSLDTLLPIVDLHQERFWEPKPEGALGLASFLYLRLHITAGWFLSTLFAAGVVGLVRRIQ